ncbi:site-specific DNA-methyltransferase [Brucella anthropi]|uniref:site-specific DNA-methyltransferase n=1 Tax=Brucella anthropi TaxID=529 RepID=UPI000DECA175|nr:site-specific DNA-methyltransferase [Brucella anthropi]RCI80050.1 site-specific DNA-methyltransferase [Brucella anthropi]
MSEIKKLVLDDPATKSADIVTGNVEALKALFPEVFTEGKIDFDVLRQLLGGAVDEKDEKYGLNWHGKRKARQIALTPSTGTLLPCPEESVDWDTTQNLMIEGDNLEVLKLLQKSYAGKVKLIYIDPPYNTGRDFVYPDDFRDGVKNYLEITGLIEGGQKLSSNTDSSGRFHTAWLNMMFPRLKAARSLLSDDGFLFISVDDGELSNARKLCDEIFGEENFIDNIIWKKRYGGGAKEKYLVSIHEYILMYAKDIQCIDEINIPLSEASVERYYTLKDEYFEERGPYRTHPLEAMKSFEDRPNLSFPIPAPDGSELWPKRQWRWGKERMAEALQRGEVAFTNNRSGGWVASSKQYLKDGNGETRSAKAFSIIDGIYTQFGTNEIVDLFGDARVFPFPKPTELIKKLIEIATSDTKDALVLDFFAGSGTTGQAVFSQNATDGGSRRYILVQLPEPLQDEGKDQKVPADFCRKLGLAENIAELTKERLRRAAIKVKTDTTAYEGDLGFRVYKLATSNIVAWEPEPSDIEGTLFANTEHLVAGRTEQDVLYELLLKLGLDLCVPIEKKDIAGKAVHSIGGGALIVCLADGFTKDSVESVASGIVAWWKALAPAVATRVVFKDSGFADDVAKANMAAILNQNGILDVRSL